MRAQPSTLLREMAPRGRDPYETLGVDAGASDAELRAAYRRLVQLHHPDHNGGSAEAARRFEEVQEAYAKIRELRATGTRGGAGARPSDQPRQPPPRQSRRPPPQPPPRGPVDSEVESRMADLERELREANRAREQARQAAREAAAAASERPSDEELGYVHTDDSFSKILADARDELVDRFSDAREHPVTKRVTDLIDELERLVSKFGERPPRPGK